MWRGSAPFTGSPLVCGSDEDHEVPCEEVVVFVDFHTGRAPWREAAEGHLQEPGPGSRRHRGAVRELLALEVLYDRVLPHLAHCPPEHELAEKAERDETPVLAWRTPQHA